MPQKAWSAKRERQYKHIKESVKEGRLSKQDISSSRRGGLRSHQGPGGRTRDQLYEEAKRRNIKGRSEMSKAELQKAVGR